MSIDKDFVLSALLQHNYLPTQRKDKEELPPRFSSQSFTPAVAASIVAAKHRVGGGFDSIDYRMTKFNGVSRSLSIPHPLAHSHLSLCIHKYWDELTYIVPNTISRIRPHQHPDGRLLIMDGYETSTEKAKRSLRQGFSKRFMAHTDIANCFPSIYSHAIPWAAVGFAHAKKHKGMPYKALWFNDLDEKVRWTKRNETQGIGIGSATSNVVSEAILARVDEFLGKSFSYVRFIDDYTAYCTTEEQAQDFIRQLSDELDKYKLLLNAKKTRIINLPQPISDDWVSELGLRMPKVGTIGGTDAYHFLNTAVKMAQAYPEGSVLKYALKALLSKNMAKFAPFDILPFALNLAFHQAALLPPIGKLFESTLISNFAYGDELHQIALENSRLHHSDGVCWCLYYLNKYQIEISDVLAQQVIKSRDCMAMLLLYDAGNAKHQSKVIDFGVSLHRSDLFDLDQYWMLLYQLFLDGKIMNPYLDEHAFDVMKSAAVNFLGGAY